MRGTTLRRWLVVVTMSLCPVLHAEASFAAPSAADRETARALLHEGDSKFDARDYAGALKAFQAAHAIMELPSTGFAVAKTQAALGLFVEARDTAQSISRLPVKSGESAPIVRARAEAQKLAGDLEKRIGSVQITVEGPSSSVPVAVTFDGESVPSEALELPRKANPGKHVVQASAPGFTTATKDVSVDEGASATVTLSLTVSASEGAPLTAPTGATPNSLQAAETPPVADTSHKQLSPLVWAGFGVGAAGLVTGTITGIVHLSKISSIKKDYCGGGTECDPGYKSALDSARPTATIADVAFAVGIAGVGVGVVGLFLSPSSSSPADHASDHERPHPGAWFTPTVGLGSVGAVGGF